MIKFGEVQRHNVVSLGLTQQALSGKKKTNKQSNNHGRFSSSSSSSGSSNMKSSA